MEEVEYELELFRVGDHSFEVTTIAFLPIEVLMANQSRDVEISGQKLWCGSLAVAEYLLGNGESWLRGSTVVELGAGTGVLGMLCKRLGALRVVLTDNDPRSLEHMKHDCVRNGIEAEVVSLDWFAARAELPSGGGITTLRIVAGDVLYKKALLEPFMRTVGDLLKQSSDPAAAQMLLCHVPRAGVDQSDVQQSAAEQALSLTALPRELWCKGAATEYCPTEDTDRAVLYLIKLAEGAR